MNRWAFFWIGVVSCAAAWALPEPGPWRRISLPGDPGMVSGIAVGERGLALAVSRGGVLLLDSGFALRSKLTDPLLGEGRKIHGLAWSGSRLWIAAEAGLFSCDPGDAVIDRARKDVPASLRTGVRAIAPAENGLWAATTATLTYFQPGRSGADRFWTLPVPDLPTAILGAGNRIFLGTSTNGLFLLDTASGGWIGFGRAEGLSSEQVTGLEWVGGEIFVATPEGLDALDLSTRKIRRVLPEAIVTWMTQVNGTLFLQTPEGLRRFASSTGAVVAETLPGDASGDALEFHAGNLLVASGGDLFVRTQPTVLGEEPLRPAPDGFQIDLPRPAVANQALQAWLRIPEWPQAKTLLSTQLLDEGKRLLVRPPPGTRGMVQIDLTVGNEPSFEEVRSLEGVYTREKPVLKVDPFRAVVRDEALEISGRTSGLAPLALALYPAGNRIPTDADGRFRTKIRLARGRNNLELVLTDAVAGQVARPIAVRRDDRAPVILSSVDDTVSGDFARLRIAYRDEGSVAGLVRGTAQFRVSVFDSFVVVEAFKLAVGMNTAQLSLEDEAGNLSTRTVRIFRKPPPEGLQASVWSLGRVPDYGEPRSAPTKPSGGQVYLLHYNMLEGETLCGVAQMFYGSQNLAPILIRWNGFADSSQWRKMPVGTPVDVPFWRDLDHTNPDVKAVLEGFPWDRVPSRSGRLP